jgi:hypothetical protein
MPFYVMLRHVALLRTDVSEERIAPSSLILVTLMMATIRSSETSALTIATRRKIPEDGILHRGCRDKLKSSIPFSSARNINLV